MALRIALVGDESEHPSHRELNALRPRLGDDARAEWVPTDGPGMAQLADFDGVWVVPGSPYADDDAVYAAIRDAREQGRPLLGTCGGLQYGVVEFVRHGLGEPGATHAESDGEDASNVVTPMACALRGESRLVTPVPGTRFADIAGTTPFEGMHFCSFAPDPAVIPRLQAAGWTVGATAPDAGAEVLELDDHPFFLLSLFQPHIGASRGEPIHPLITAFLDAARDTARAARNTAHATPGRQAS